MRYFGDAIVAHDHSALSKLRIKAKVVKIELTYFAYLTENGMVSLIRYFCFNIFNAVIRGLGHQSIRL